MEPQQQQQQQQQPPSRSPKEQDQHKEQGETGTAPEPKKGQLATDFFRDDTIYSKEVQDAINEVVPGEDPLDRVDFDPIDYINKAFPDESSLEHLDEIIRRMGSKIKRLDDDIVTSVRAQMDSSASGKRELESAQASIQELAVKIQDIKEKAEASGKLVNEICKDIKSLDYAKTNLTVSINVLEKLQMLCKKKAQITSTIITIKLNIKKKLFFFTFFLCVYVFIFVCTASGVSQLKSMLSNGKYSAAGAKLQAVVQLVNEFSSYRERVPKVQELEKSMVDLEEEAKKLACMEFQEVFRGRKPVEACLGGVCELVGAFSEKGREDFFRWFCDAQLEGYRRKFEDGTEEAQLEHMDRRYVWFRAAFQEIGDRYGAVFPAEWRMDERFSEEFCCLTKLSLIRLLDTPDAAINVTALVTALRRTTEFENALSDIFEPEDDIDEILAQQERDYARIKDPERRERYIKEGRQRALEAAGIDPSAAAGDSNGGEVYVRPKKFKGIISSVFSRHMDVYVEQERANVKDMFERMVKEERWSLEEVANSKIFGSCTDLIYYMKTTMSRCMEISLDEPLLKVHEIIRSYLAEYARVLAQHFPPDNTSRMKEDALKITCVIVNTAEFCKSRCDQFQRTFRKKIISKLADKISFKSAADEFKKACITRGIGLLSTLVCNTLEAPLAEMYKTNWSAVTDVGDSSPYAYTISATVEAALPVARHWLTDIPGLPTKHWQIFLDIFATQFMRLHLDALYKCRKVGDFGAQVLLLDLASLRKLLLKLPLLGTPEAAAADVTQMDDVFYQSQAGNSSSSSSSAQKAAGVNKEVERWRKFVENTINAQNIVLKVIIGQPETMVATYKALMPKGSAENFQKIIELKAGLSKLDKMALMDEYNNVPAGERSFSSSSSSILGVPHSLGETGAELKKKTKDMFGKITGLAGESSTSK